MPIKNYTTKVDATKTAGEISRILARSGARKIQQEFDADGDMVALSFSLVVAEQELFYRLPARPEGVLRTLHRDGAERRFLNLKQAKRVAWRIVRDWIDAQLAMIDAGAAAPEEVFFPYMMVARDKTLFEAITDRGGLHALARGGLPALTAGEKQ